MGKRWLKPQNSRPVGQPRQLGTHGQAWAVVGCGGQWDIRPCRQTSDPCAGGCREGCSAPTLPAPAPGVPLLSRCRLRSSWGRGMNYFS